MATFQSQINILAAGQHRLHSKIEELTEFKLQVKYDSLATFIWDKETQDSIEIKDLGYNAYDCMLTVEQTETTSGSESFKIHFMDNKGSCDDFIVNGTATNIANVKIQIADSSSGTLATDGTLTLQSDIFSGKTTATPVNYRIIDLGKPLTTPADQKPIIEGA